MLITITNSLIVFTVNVFEESWFDDAYLASGFSTFTLKTVLDILKNLN